MAGGPGGNIYPALAVGTELRKRGINVYWMGVRSGLEDRLARSAGFEFDAIRIKGLWGKGPIRWITMPLWLAISLWQSVAIILHRRPDVMLGMGGYVCGPGGLAAVLLGCPLIIHESNAVAGLTNRLLSRLAARVLSGVPKSDLGRKTVFTGTPVREEIIVAAKAKAVKEVADQSHFNLLVIGGSQGASALNVALPIALQDLPKVRRPSVMHQTGWGGQDGVCRAYEEAGIDARVIDYIEDMPDAYQWADLVVARAGAVTIAELSVMGLAVILVPFPFAARDHQRANAELVVRHEGAVVCLQQDRFATRLGETLVKLTADWTAVHAMAKRFQAMARPDATEAVTRCCMEMLSA